jgi:hypothetical protein
LHRTDKITQLRILIGLLGFDTPGAEVDAILTQAQESPTYEDWVRVVAGLVQGIMFVEEEEDEDSRSARGEEAGDLLERTCQAILENVQELERATASVGNDNMTSAPRATADADPTFAPYHYALLHSELLHRVIPETKSHAHFQVNQDAEILKMDAKQEAAKTQEEKEHVTSLASRAAQGSIKPTSARTTTTATPNFPGFRSSSSKAKPAVQRQKPSMFLSAKKPAPVARTGLHTRKAGAAQSLVGKGRNVFCPTFGRLKITGTCTGKRGLLTRLRYHTFLV